MAAKLISSTERNHFMTIMSASPNSNSYLISGLHDDIDNAHESKNDGGSSSGGYTMISTWPVCIAMVLTHREKREKMSKFNMLIGDTFLEIFILVEGGASSTLNVMGSIYSTWFINVWTYRFTCKFSRKRCRNDPKDRLVMMINRLSERPWRVWRLTGEYNYGLLSLLILCD